jgi:hypothetical protein
VIIPNGTIIQSIVNILLRTRLSLSKQATLTNAKGTLFAGLLAYILIHGTFGFTYGIPAT